MKKFLLVLFLSIYVSAEWSETFNNEPVWCASVFGSNVNLCDIQLTDLDIPTFPYWYSIGGYITSNNSINSGNVKISKNILIEGNLSFENELLPDGDFCSEGDIIIKLANNNWKCLNNESIGGANIPDVIQDSLIINGSLEVLDYIYGDSTFTSNDNINRLRSTAWISGGNIIRENSTHFSISSGVAQFINYSSDNHDVYNISFAGWNNITSQWFGISPLSVIWINSTGDYEVTFSLPSFEFVRTHVGLGGFLNVLPGGNEITHEFSTSEGEIELMRSFVDFTTLFRTRVNAEGNTFSGTNLNISKTVGVNYRHGVNAKINELNPNRIDVPSCEACRFGYVHRDGVGGSNLSFYYYGVRPGFYDDGDGTLGTVLNNQWSIQRIYYAGDVVDIIDGQPFIAIHYGQHVYTTKQEALENIVLEDFEESPILGTSIRSTFLVIRGGATDLDDLADAQFEPADVAGAGGGGGGAVGSLQTAYDNSDSTEISLTSLQGALTIDYGELTSGELFSIGNGSKILQVAHENVTIGVPIITNDTINTVKISVNTDSTLSTLNVGGDINVTDSVYIGNDLLLTDDLFIKNGGNILFNYVGNFQPPFIVFNLTGNGEFTINNGIHGNIDLAPKGGSDVRILDSGTSPSIWLKDGGDIDMNGDLKVCGGDSGCDDYSQLETSGGIPMIKRYGGAQIRVMSDSPPNDDYWVQFRTDLEKTQLQLEANGRTVIVTQFNDTYDGGQAAFAGYDGLTRVTSDGAIVLCADAETVDCLGVDSFSDGTPMLTVWSGIRIAINATLFPRLTGVFDLGRSSEQWENLYVNNALVEGLGVGTDTPTMELEVIGDGNFTGSLWSGDHTPVADSTYNLGTNTIRWANIYADDFYGNYNSMWWGNPANGDEKIVHISYNDGLISEEIQVTDLVSEGILVSTTKADSYIFGVNKNSNDVRTFIKNNPDKVLNKINMKDLEEKALAYDALVEVLKDENIVSNLDEKISSKIQATQMQL